jgi:hypothetical protein
MIGHQTVGVELDTKFNSQLCKILKVELKVFVRGKDDLSVMTALNDVMGNSGDHDSRLPGHGLFLLNTEGERMASIADCVTKINLSPFNARTGGTSDTIPQELGKPQSASLDNGYFSQTNIEELGDREIEP